MSRQKYFQTLKKILQFGFAFMIFEATYHFSGLRTNGVENIWPESAVTFSKLFVLLWSSISLFMSGLLYHLQKSIEKNQEIIIWTGFFSLFHGLLLWFVALQHIEKTWPLANLYAWLPNYSGQLFVEGFILILYFLFIMYGSNKHFLK